MYKCIFPVLVISILHLSECFAQNWRWKLQSQAPSVNPDFHAILDFCKNIAVMTNNRLIIDPISGDSDNKLAKGAGIFRVVEKGIAQMAVGWPNWWHQIDPAWNALQSGPYGFMNLDASMMWFYIGN